MQSRALAILVVLAVSIVRMSSAIHAQTQPREGKAEAGHAVALQACTGCHVVAPDQPFKPIYTGHPHPPDFKEIANRPNTTAASLRHHLEALPAVPQDLHMADPLLSNQQLLDVVAFIVSLRDQSGPSR